MHPVSSVVEVRRAWCGNSIEKSGRLMYDSVYRPQPGLYVCGRCAVVVETPGNWPLFAPSHAAVYYNEEIREGSDPYTD